MLEDSFQRLVRVLSKDFIASIRRTQLVLILGTKELGNVETNLSLCKLFGQNMFVYVNMWIRLSAKIQLNQKSHFLTRNPDFPSYNPHSAYFPMEASGSSGDQGLVPDCEGIVSGIEVDQSSYNDQVRNSKRSREDNDNHEDHVGEVEGNEEDGDDDENGDHYYTKRPKTIPHPREWSKTVTTTTIYQLKAFQIKDYLHQSECLKKKYFSRC
jgi:hypothetical protein